ncbi:NAD(P)H-binding protein [Oceaniradius stylonematis]|uniref:NmrA family NAD(P)-binding protein n=1 Tax=Oceaniradius stylonematis TaxID=2184161 RepID=UPI00273D362B|nr:NAD(P)H-binding protein [Oceaniradius stylonematis]
MSTIVIAGAAGRIGHAAAEAFIEAGWTVRGIARGAKLGRLPAGVEPVEADAMDREAMIAACAGADVVLHALNPPYDKWDELAMPMAENVIAAARAAGATVMLPGNVYNYGTAVRPGLTEDTPMAPDTEKGRIRVAIEDRLRAESETGPRSVVLRAGDFFGGPVDGSWFDLVIAKDLRKGRVVWPGRRDIDHAFAFMPDFARAFVMVADRRETLPPFARLHFAGHTATGQQFHAAMETAVGRPLRNGAAPWTIMRVIGLFNPLVREVVKMRYLWDTPHSLDNTRLEALIGAEPHTPLETALAEAVAAQALGGA